MRCQGNIELPKSQRNQPGISEIRTEKVASGTIPVGDVVSVTTVSRLI